MEYSTGSTWIDQAKVCSASASPPKGTEEQRRSWRRCGPRFYRRHYTHYTTSFTPRLGAWLLTWNVGDPDSRQHVGGMMEISKSSEGVLTCIVSALSLFRK